MRFGNNSKFTGTEDVLEAVESADPDDSHLSAPEGDGEEVRVRKVVWRLLGAYTVKVPAKNILFMEGNQWNYGLARALYDGIIDGSNPVLETPAGRIHRVTAADVKLSEKYAKAGELEYQMNMTSPWTRSEIGEYYAQLVDGNHRAAAAILAGEPYLYVYCGENYRENVRKKDWL